MPKNELPYIINFTKVGGYSLGYLSYCQRETLPFVPKRIYWIYYTPHDVERGSHAHYQLEQIIVALAGSVTIKIEMTDGSDYKFVLDSPDKGLFVPKRCWRGIKYSHNAVLMCIASKEYSEKDYIRDYLTFKKQTRET